MLKMNELNGNQMTTGDKKILKVQAFTPISKPLNGSLPRSNNSHFLRLYPISYWYRFGKEEKESIVETYYIKGLRGSIRHAVMRICKASHLEVCHTTDKEMDKSGNRLLPDGFHLLGTCEPTGSCIVHEIFGSKGRPGLISVYADPIGSITQKSAELTIPVQDVHIATESRHCATFDGKIAQDFGERYFSGYFKFEIDVTHCLSKHIGLLIESILNVEKLGRGYNAGYGHVQVLSFQLIKRIIKKTVVWQENDFVIQEIKEEVYLKDEVMTAMNEWKKYTEEHTCK